MTASDRIRDMMSSPRREQAYRALQKRQEDLGKLAKKEEDLGLDTTHIEEAILQTKGAISDLIGQGEFDFKGTPMEDAAEASDEDVVEADYEVVDEGHRLLAGEEPEDEEDGFETFPTGDGEDLEDEPEDRDDGELGVLPDDAPVEIRFDAEDREYLVVDKSSGEVLDSDPTYQAALKIAHGQIAKATSA